MVYNLYHYYYQGAQYAVNQSNLNNDIPNFNIELFSTDCGIFEFDVNWYIGCYEPILSKMGIAYLSALWVVPAIGNLYILKALGMQLPQISPFSQGSQADDRAQFPEFVKLSVTDKEFYTSVGLYTLSLGWKNVVIIYTDDSTATEQYTEVLLYVVTMGISILNPENLRKLPANYTRNDFETYKSVFQAAKDTNCKIFVVLCYDNGAVWEGLYDIGLRKGDFLSITSSSVLNYFTGIPEPYLSKRIELMVGSLVIGYKEYSGELGAKLEATFLSMGLELPYLCMCYDGVSVLKSTVNYILSVGEDYENPTTFERVMRNSKLVGCLGNIYFDSQSNSRGAAQFVMQQVRITSNNTLYVKDVAIIDQLSSQIIQIIAPYQWPDGSTLTPDNYNPVNPCPFDTYMIIDSPKARGLRYGICVIFLILSILTARFVAKTHQEEFHLLSEQRIITFSDMMYLSYFLFQFFQIITMGPDQDSYVFLAGNIHELIAINIDLYLNLTFTKFWILFYTITLFTIVCGIKNEKSACTERLIFLAEMPMPIFGHICFLSLLSMLMNIYQCDNGIGNNLTDSYLNQDCTTFCYTGAHQTYVILGSLCISLFIPLAIYSRPHWETAQRSLNLKTKPSYLAILSVFQVTLVIFNKTIKPLSQIIHGFLSTALTILFLYYTIKARPFNYQRTQALQSFSLILSIWGLFTATIFRFQSNLTMWTSVEFIGFLIILVIGFLVMRKYPTFLYSPQGQDVSTLFLFQFCKTYEEYIKERSTQDFSQKGIVYRIDDSKFTKDGKGKLFDD